MVILVVVVHLSECPPGKERFQIRLEAQNSWSSVFCLCSLVTATNGSVPGSMEVTVVGNQCGDSNQPSSLGTAWVLAFILSYRAHLIRSGFIPRLLRHI